MGSFKFDTDYGSLAAALTAAAGEVLVISANHSITAPHTVPANTHLFGNGGSITITDADENALDIGGDGVTIEGVEIVGPSSASNPPDVIYGNGIHAASRHRLTVKDCLIRGFNSCGILLRGCRDANLRGNRLYGNVSGLGDSSDICLYGTGADRCCIEGNFCLSNNSQGIYVDANGGDDEIAVLGNICVATNGGEEEMGLGSLQRRHGIIIGYGSPAVGNGRITVCGNLCRNSLWTGIYLASSEELRRGVVVTGNVCSLNGLDDDSSLAGGIYILGGGLGTLVANNAVYDFRGTAAQDVGGLVVNHSIAGATATLSGNVCDTSSADGIVLKGAANGVRVIGNRTYAIARYDLSEVPNASNAAFGGNRIEQNEFARTNSDYPSVFISAQDSARTTYILDNVIAGFDEEVEDSDNTGLRIAGGVGTKPVVATGNLIRNFRNGIVNYGYLSNRYNDLLRLDYNEFQQCEAGIVLAGTTTAGVMVVEGNRFSAVTNRVSGASGPGGAGDPSAIIGYSVGYIGRRDNDRLVLLGLNAAPTVGTWAVGDRAEYTGPSAGGNIGAVCTGAGNPGTWKTYGAIAA